jgi:spermidine synthase
MLSAFILGLSLGAMYLRARSDRVRDAIGTLGIVQSVMGACAVLSLPLYLALFRLMAALLSALTASAQGYMLFTIARYGLCLAIMLPATFCAGLTLPLVTDALLRSTKKEGAIGLVYGVNTVGAILGAVVGALLLLPLIGARGLLVAAALGDVALGVMLLMLRGASHPRRTAMPLGFAVGSLVLLFATVWQSSFDRAMITAGVFRTRRLPEPGLQKILFYRDGRTATVSAAYTLPGRTTLSTNGKVDASLDDAWYHKLPAGAPRRGLGDDATTQTLMPIIGLAHRPDARRAAVIGHGSGMSAHFLLGSPTIESVTTVEIEPQMILGSTVFYPVNRRVFDDARSHFVNADARSFFSSSPTHYDLIVSEPSNPWVSGVSSLFTQEFYARAARRLNQGGVFVQWVQMYETSDALLLDIVAAVHRSFRSYALYRTGAVDMVIVASNATSLLTPDWSVVRWPALAADLADVVPFTPQSLEALRFADRAVFAPLLDGFDSPNSDFHSSLDRDAEEQRFLGQTASGFISLAEERFDPFLALTGRRQAIGTEVSTPFPEVARTREAAIAARIHAHNDGGPRATDAETNALLMRVQMFDTFIAGNAAPEDWQIWVRNFILVERSVHGLSSGAVDEEFYTRVREYLKRAHGPAGAMQSVALYHALAAWDFQEAAASADQLFPSLALGISWVPRTTLRDAAVVAKLLTGDIAGARRVFETLTPPMERASLRARLLEAHLRALQERDKA